MDVDRSGPGGYRHCRLFSLLLRRNGDRGMFTQQAPSINCGFQKHGGLTGTTLLLAFKIFPHRPVVMIATLDPFVNESRVAKIVSFARDLQQPVFLVSWLRKCILQKQAILRGFIA
jgi:hypothetical protein